MLVHQRVAMLKFVPTSRFPKIGDPNHPSRGWPSLSIVTHGFGDPPFEETAISENGNPKNGWFKASFSLWKYPPVLKYGNAKSLLRNLRSPGDFHAVSPCVTMNSPRDIQVFFPSSIPLFRYGGVHFYGVPQIHDLFRENPNMDDLGVPLWIGNHFMDFPQKKTEKCPASHRNSLRTCDTFEAGPPFAVPQRCRSWFVSWIQGWRWANQQNVLVGGWPTLWKIWVSWDDYSQDMGKEKMFQTTNQCLGWTGLFRTAQLGNITKKRRSAAKMWS